MFDFHDLSKTIKTINKNDLDKYIESIYLEFNNYLLSLNSSELDNIKYDIEDILYDLIKYNLISENNSKIMNSFLLLLSEQFEQLHLTGAIVEILHYLPDSSVKKRLKASVLYLKINDLTKQYHENFDDILSLISQSDEDEEYRYKTINAILNFFLSAMSQFVRVKNSNLSNSFKQLFLNKQEKYTLLKDKFIIDIVSNTTIENYNENISSIKQKINSSKLLVSTCVINKKDISKEEGEYCKKVLNIQNPTFKDIQQICTQYIKEIGNPQELYDRLNRGTVIIDDEKLLYKYITSFGAKHKTKLYDAFEVIKDKLDNQTINIVDWGCGQAFATMILLDFIKEKSVNLKISDICLIEPSKLALERGLLHVDVFKQGEYKIKAINSDLDCIKEDDISFDNDNKILHIFSNILDLESFKLNTDFLQKISKNINSDNMFVCVSPNINDKRNSRLDLFYNHFDENFNTELISSRSDDIFGNTRYEKIFEVIYAKPQEVTQSREEVKEYSLDIYSKLEKYTQIIEPILDSSKVKENIEKDPDYVIFKIRKVTEVITSKIYGKYEANENRISQNDKIRYLKFEKIINRKIESHLHTIRTIGNIGAHEHIENPIEMLTEDAYFLTTALILLIEELLKQKIIVLDN